MNGTTKAVIFVDGENWSRAVSKQFRFNPEDIDYSGLFRQLVQKRELVFSHWYTSPRSNEKEANSQKLFLERLTVDPKIRVWTGSTVKKECVPHDSVTELNKYLDGLDKGQSDQPWSEDSLRTTQRVFGDLRRMASQLRKAKVRVEKQVDVKLAVDLVTYPKKDYDAVYLLSADSDFIPAIQEVKKAGKIVYVVSPQHAAELGSYAQCFIHLRKEEVAPFMLSSGATRNPDHSAVHVRSGDIEVRSSAVPLP